MAGDEEIQNSEVTMQLILSKKKSQINQKTSQVNAYQWIK